MSAHIWHTISLTVVLVDRVTISVDVRERRSALPSHLSELGLVVRLVTLQVGDYVVGDRVLERKTVADLHRSLTGGRLWRQVAALRQDPRSAYLIVEGPDLDAGPIPARAVRGALLKVLDNGIRVLRAKTSEDSAVWIDVLAQQEWRRLAGRASRQVRQRRTVISPVGVVAAIPGIGLESARLLIAAFGSLTALAEASDDELRSVPGIGPARARALRAALTASSSVSPAQAGETLR